MVEKIGQCRNSARGKDLTVSVRLVPISPEERKERLQKIAEVLVESAVREVLENLKKLKHREDSGSSERKEVLEIEMTDTNAGSIHSKKEQQGEASQQQ